MLLVYIGYLSTKTEIFDRVYLFFQASSTINYRLDNDLNEKEVSFDFLGSELGYLLFGGVQKSGSGNIWSWYGLIKGKQLY